ncbi:MAG: hypothetical protein WBO09_20905 [Methylocystis silviterrae]
MIIPCPSNRPGHIAGHGVTEASSQASNVMAAAGMERPLIYVLEFFAEDIENENCPRLRIKHRAKTLALAEQHARAEIKNVTVGDKKACGCLIKDQLGKLMREVRADSGQA